MSMELVVTGFTSAHFSYIFNVKGGRSPTERFSVLVSRPSDDPSLVSKLVAV